MAKATIQDITTAQSFQNWFDKTNELVGLMREEVVTASIAGDSTTGNATLIGDFTTTNINVSDTLSIDTVIAFTASGNVDFVSPVTITGTTGPVCATFSYGAGGGRTRYTDGSTSWDIGMEDSVDANFIINTGVGANKFELTPGGTLTLPDLVVTGSVSGTAFDGLGAPTDSDEVPEGATNLYYTTARSNSAIDARVDKTFVDALNVDADTLDTLNSTSFLRSDESDSMLGDLTVTGNVNVTGDVTTNHTVSDIRLKENLLPIDAGLNKLLSLTGYTFNYIDNPDVPVTGLVAQELEQVLPEAVYEFEHKNGDSYKAIRYGNVVSLLVEAIKELSLKVDELEKR
tara:strand:+ start:611 stop:1642 length:1032 start_codon:yes stop_codon:yes gene_type:complete